MEQQICVLTSLAKSSVSAAVSVVIRMSLSLLVLMGLRFTLLTVNTSSLGVTFSTSGAHESASASGMDFPL